MSGFEFRTVPDILCRRDSLAQLDDILRTRNWPGPVLVITDPGVRSALDLDTLLAPNRCRIEIFDAVEADPRDEIIQAALDHARQCAPAVVIGIGGGSAMDTAKLVAVLLGTTQLLETMYGVGAVQGPRRLPLVLVPTTAGTGSEVTPISIVTTGATTKMGIVSPQLLPDLAILDATLTLALPAAVTAHTGIDAMVHAIEAYTSRHKKNPLSDFHARAALQLLWHNLPRVMADGSDIEARENMLLGACLAGQAFANAPVGAVHALAYPLGGIFHLTHGLSNALVLPHVLKFNMPQAATHYAELAALLGISPHGTAFVDALEARCASTGIARRLRDAEIPHAALEQLADAAMLQTRLLQNNPRELALQDALDIYEQAW